MKNKKYTAPHLEIIVFNNNLCLVSASSNTLKFGDKYSDEEQFSQKKEQESIWDDMNEE